MTVPTAMRRSRAPLGPLASELLIRRRRRSRCRPWGPGSRGPAWRGPGKAEPVAAQGPGRVPGRALGLALAQGPVPEPGREPPGPQARSPVAERASVREQTGRAVRSQRPPPPRAAASSAGAAPGGRAGRPLPEGRECVAPASEERGARPDAPETASHRPPASHCPRRRMPRRWPHTPHRPRLRAERSRGWAGAGPLGAGLEAEVDSFWSLPAADGEHGLFTDEPLQGDRHSDLRSGPQATLERP
jgi:hypothetical protein